MFKYLLLAAFVPALLAFEQCSSGVSQPDSVVSSICAAGDTCQIVEGQSVDITAVFVAAADAETVTPLVLAYIGDMVAEIPPTTIADGCANITPGCPIVAGNTYTYSVDVPANDLPISGGVEVEVELALISVESGEAITCIRFPASIN